MKFNAWRGIVAAILLLSLSTTASAAPRMVVLGGDAREAQISPSGAVRHRAADFDFPNLIGDMPLRKVIVYGPADVSVDYSLRGGGNGDAWVTFFVYPVKRSFGDELSYIERNLVKETSATRITAPAKAPASALGGRGGWFKGVREGIRLTTGYMLVQRNAWFLQARFSIPEQAGQAGINRTVNALYAAPWDWKPQAGTRR